MPRKSCHGHGSTTARPVILCFFLSSGRRHRFVAARAGYKFAKQPRVPHVGVSAAAAFMGQQKEALSAACWQRTLELELELISAAAAQRLMVNSLDSWAFTFASPMPAEAHNVAHTPHITNRRASTDYKSSEQTMRRAPKSHWHHPPTTTPFPDQPQTVNRMWTYHVSLGTLVDVMRRDYHSGVAIFRDVHQMIPNAGNDKKELIRSQR